MTKTNYIIRLALFVVPISIFYFLSTSNPYKWEKFDIEREFKGVVYSKEITNRASLMSIKDTTNQILNVKAIIREDLFNYVNLGDSVFKQKKSNYCYVKKKNDTTYVKFCYIEFGNRNSKDFPIEWENKWRDCDPPSSSFER